MTESISPRPMHTPAAAGSAGTRPVGNHPAGAIGGCPFHNAAGRGDVQMLRDLAQQTIKDRVFGDESLQKAVTVLERALRADPADAQGKTNLLLGQVHAQLQNWGDAEKHLDVALARDPHNAAAADLRASVQSNQRMGLKPELALYGSPFDLEKLRAPPAQFLPEPELSAPVIVANPKSRVRQALQNVAGAVLNPLTNGAEWLAFHTRDKSQTYAFKTWDLQHAGDTGLLGQAKQVLGLLRIAGTRKDLVERLQVATPRNALVFNQQPGQRWPEHAQRFPTHDGTWVTANPREGAVGAPFGQLGLDPAQSKNRMLDPTLPSVADVSVAFKHPRGERQYAPFVSDLFGAWIQLFTHSNFENPVTHSDGAYEVELPKDDPRRATFGVDKLYIPKTVPAPTAKVGENVQASGVPMWWHLGPVYGNDPMTAQRLRTGADGAVLADGKLRIDGDTLPINPKTGVEDVGISNNWNLQLSVLHILFVKQHNWVVDELKKAYPNKAFTSDDLYNYARLINILTFVKIHTVEWTPAVFPNMTLTAAMGTGFWGAIERKLKAFETRTIDNGWEPRNEVLAGFVGGERDNTDKAFAFAKEFPQVYRFHGAVPDSLKVRRPGSDAVLEEIPLTELRGASAHKWIEKYGADVIAHSVMMQPAPALVAHNLPKPMTAMAVNGNTFVDIGATDEARARERGVPPFNEARVRMGMNPIKSFDELGCSAEDVALLYKMYGHGSAGLAKLDFDVGCDLEATRPGNFGISETRFQPFIISAPSRVLNNPFFTSKLTPEYYTERGLQIVANVSMKELLMRHFPALANSDLRYVNNAFEPINSNAVTNPGAHPLTSTKSEKYAYDHSLDAPSAQEALAAKGIWAEPQRPLPPPAAPIRVLTKMDGKVVKKPVAQHPMRLFDKKLERAVAVDPKNGRAWADLNNDGVIAAREELKGAERDRALAAAEQFNHYFVRPIPKSWLHAVDFVVASTINEPELLKLRKGASVPARRSQLKVKLDFMDRDNDGVIRPRDTFNGSWEVGDSKLRAALQAAKVGVIFGKWADGMAVDIESIDEKRYPNATGIYDDKGFINEEKMAEYLAHFHARGGTLTQDELMAVLEKNGVGFVSRGQFKTLFRLCERLNGSKTVTAEQFYQNFEGTLYWHAASKDERDGTRRLHQD